MVLIREDNTPRVITRLFPGKDGLVRSVELKTNKGTSVRSIQRLHDLEVQGVHQTETVKNTVPSDQIHNKDQAVGIDNSANGQSGQGIQPNNKTTRSGRVIKPKRRFDL
jgi:hypothetical protein